MRWIFVAFFATISATAFSVSAQALVPEPVKLARVSGVVVDAGDGRVLRRAMVCLDRGADTGYSDLTTPHCNETDAQGRFNIVNLPSARYGLDINREGYFAEDPVAEGINSLIALKAGDEMTGIRIRMQRAAAISGRVVFDDGEPFPGAELQLAGGSDARARTAESGEYRFGNLRPGDYRIYVNYPSARNCDGPEVLRRRLYVPRQAKVDSTRIHVDFGQQVNWPAIVLVEAMPHRVAGRVVWPDYPLPNRWTVSIDDVRIPVKSSDGSFAICGLAPGEYALSTNQRIDGRSVAGDLKIQIEDEDLKNLEIVAELSATIHARIEVKDHALLDLANSTIISATDSAPPHNSVPQPRRQPDGSFILDEVYAGEYRFFLSPLPSGSYLKSARINGQDVLDAPLLVHGGENLDGLVFTVSSKAAAVTGVVNDEAGSPVLDANVVLQPDPRHGDRDFHVCFKNADQNGAFSCDGLAPGKYRVAAWRTAPDVPRAWNEVASKGSPVEVPEGGRVAIVLTVLK